jgi:4'-phosphopantetheinyl transferase
VPLATLPEGEVHLHLARPDAITDEADLAVCRALLSPVEHERCARFRHAHLRHAALITRALVRTTLSLYADVPPASWRFSSGTHGRPEVDGDAHGLCFNVAHTEGLVVCAVARGATHGVDVEHVALRAEPVTMAEHFFAPREIAALRVLEGDALHERFLAIWTLKEAYAKARGLGLSLPLDRYAITFDDRGRAHLWVDESIREDAAAWQLERRALGPHRVALAVRLDRPEQEYLVRVFDGLSGPLPRGKDSPRT